jgi:hypothetical protein
MPSMMEKDACCMQGDFYSAYQKPRKNDGPSIVAWKYNAGCYLSIQTLERR